MKRFFLFVACSLSVLSFACSSNGNGETPTATPQAQATPRATTAGSPANLTARTVSILELSQGDCFNRDASSGPVREVELVPCTAGWQYRVVGRFNVMATGSYPGENYFNEQAGRLCPFNTDITIAPGPTTWDEGDRTVLCVQQRTLLP